MRRNAAGTDFTVDFGKPVQSVELSQLEPVTALHRGFLHEVRCLSREFFGAPVLQTLLNVRGRKEELTALGNDAVSGAGLLIVEMTNVEARGRISPRCLGLYSDDNEEALALHPANGVVNS